MDIVFALLYGLAGTGVMSFVLRIAHEANFSGAEEVYAIGSVVPRPPGSSPWPGIVIHLLAGMGFALLYLAIGDAILLYAPGLLLLGAGIGLLRGLGVSLVLNVLAADQNPWQRFLDAGPVPAIWHLVGNLLYGLTVSVLFGVTNVNWMLVF